MKLNDLESHERMVLAAQMGKIEGQFPFWAEGCIHDKDDLLVVERMTGIAEFGHDVRVRQQFLAVGGCPDEADIADEEVAIADFGQDRLAYRWCARDPSGIGVEQQFGRIARPQRLDRRSKGQRDETPAGIAFAVALPGIENADWIDRRNDAIPARPGGAHGARRAAISRMKLRVLS